MDSAGNVKLDCPALGKQTGQRKVSAQVLRKLCDDASSFLGDSVTKAVITVPAYFNDSQRQATKDAGQIAGIDVCVSSMNRLLLRLHMVLREKPMETILIFDLGGGTFDVFIGKLAMACLRFSTSGDTHLGGDDFDKEN